MSYRDQQKLLDELKKHVVKLDTKELADYKMFIKRQKDDEDFDSVSMRRLKELYHKYHQSVDKSKYDHFFKKSDE
ncbi:MAG TPA: hypothetical protein VK870_13760 [Ignavibacteriaceae bacterium]|nr:hypothetical protein [Ignavibacteriaceae bacterium]